MADPKHPQALTNYLERIGAEVLSFRRAMVKEYHHGDNYYVERTLIKIGPDGTIDCSREEHAPTPEEQAAIIEAFKDMDFPKSIPATKANYKDWLDQQEGDKSRFYALCERGGNVLMVQERCENKAGAKYFIPHSFWSDDEWRSMEPDGLLPLWKPEQKSRARVMIHEGCKAAKFATELCRDQERLKAHPWGKELDAYEHWGWIGGALAPHRTDYKSIHVERFTEVVYVCDNDFAGECALQAISKHYGQSMKGIRFGEGFKTSWDMADPMPEKFFTKGGRYTGPSLKSLIKPATRATEKFKASNAKGSKSFNVLTYSFRSEWMHTIKPEVFIHRDFPHNVMSASEFNSLVSPFSDVDDTARLMRKEDAAKAFDIKYDPSKKPGIWSGENRYVNCYFPPDIKAMEGDITPFMTFMKNLVTDDNDRFELMRWCATLIARPDIKMLYGVLLISETQGVGKGTLGEKILAPLMGELNVSYPSESDITDADFNYWMSHKRLAVVHEIYAGQSAKAYNKLKSVITDHYITVSKKYLDKYVTDNYLHIFACSNSRRAIQLSTDDRRWFVPKIAEEKQSPEYWTDFNDWLIDGCGLEKIRWWAEQFVKQHRPVMKGEDAPWSQAKTDVVEDGFSPGMLLVGGVFDQLNEELKKPVPERWARPNSNPYRDSRVGDDVIILDIDLVELIRRHIYNGQHNSHLERPMTMRRIAKLKGWKVSEERYTVGAKWGNANNFRMIFSSNKYLKCKAKTLVDDGLLPLDLKAWVEI